MSVIERALKLLKVREFIGVATTDNAGNPNSAPKLLLKTDGRTAYFIDYSIGKTAENLKINPKAAFSFIDLDSLFGYRLSGKVEIIEKGKIYEDCLNELRKKEIELSAERIVKGVQAGKAHQAFEMGISERFLVYKVKVEEVVEISPRGELRQEKSG